MGWIKKAFNFIVSPSHSRTMALVGMLVLVSAVSLTVAVSQQQQTLKQRAASATTYTLQIDWSGINQGTEGQSLNNGAPYTVYVKSQDASFSTQETTDDTRINIKVPDGTYYDVAVCAKGVSYTDMFNNDCLQLTYQHPSSETKYDTSSLPPCGSNLDCTDNSSEVTACESSGRNLCLDFSSIRFKDAEKFTSNGSIGGKVCCNAKKYAKGSDGICKLELYGQYDTLSACTTETSAPAAGKAPASSTCTQVGGTCIDSDGFQHISACYGGRSYGLVQTCNTSSGKCEETTLTCPQNNCNPDSAGILKCQSSAGTAPAAPATGAAPAAPAAGTNPADAISNLFDCSTPSKDAAGNYQCAPITRGVLECPSDFEIYSYSQTSCPANEGCCKQNPLAPTPTPTQTPTANLFTCANQTGPAAGNYQCATIINGAVQCPSGYGVYSPSNPYTGTSCSANKGCCKQGAATQANLFTCQNQTGTYAGNYACANIVNGTTQCPSNYTAYSPSASFTGTSCGTTRGCCKQNAIIPTPTSTPTPTPTPVPVNNVTLALTLNAQDLPATTSATTSNLSADLTLYNLTTNSTVADAALEKPQSFTKTSITGKQYSKNITLTNLQPVKYFIVARKDNMIAKAVFNVSSTTETIAVPTTTLVFGDINNDNTIDPLDWNIFRDCWKKPATGSCASSDFNKSGNAVDQIDYNTWLRGLQTWNTEAKNL